MNKKILLKLFVAIMLPFSILLFISGCATSSLEETGEGYSPENEVFSNYANEVYGTDKHNSFAKLKVLERYNGYYSAGSDRYYVIECEIAEDYYGVRKPGQRITLAISSGYVLEGKEKQGLKWVDVVKHGFFNDSDIERIFDGEYVLAHFTEFDQRLGGDINGVFKDTQIYATSLLNYRLMPIKDGRLDVQTVRSLYDFAGYEPTKDFLDIFSEYFCDGMSEEELKVSISKLDGDLEKDRNRYNEENGITSYNRKMKTELLKIGEEEGIVSLTVDEIDVYLDYITVTVEAVGEGHREISVVSPVWKEENGEWAVFDSFYLQNAQNEEDIGTFILESGEKCTVKLKTASIKEFGKYKLPISVATSPDLSECFIEIVIETKALTDE